MWTCADVWTWALCMFFFCVCASFIVQIPNVCDIIQNKRTWSNASGYKLIPTSFIVAIPNRTTSSLAGMTATMIGGHSTDPHGACTLSAIGTVLWVAVTGAPVAVCAVRGPFPGGSRCRRAQFDHQGMSSGYSIHFAVRIVTYPPSPHPNVVEGRL